MTPRSTIPRLRLSAAAALLAALVALVPAGRVQAGGPLLISDDGTPVVWDSRTPLVLRPGTEVLGGIRAPTELLRHAALQWNGVDTSTLELEIGDDLSPGYEDLSAAELERLTQRNDGINPVIFDADGSIFRELFGARSGILAISGPSLFLPSTGKIVKGFALFNGEEAEAGLEEAFKAVFTHEIGHVLGLDHTQINGLHLGEQVTGYDETIRLEHVTTMFPVLLRRSASPHPMAILHMDDRTALSALYPTDLFGRTTGSVSGFVFDFDGLTQLQGVNVIARNVDNPLGDAVSYVSGQRAHRDNDLEPRGLRGFYELAGLTPNASYELSIEEVSSHFTGGSSIGPLDPPNDVDPSGSAEFLEFWNGAAEAGADPPDDPLDRETIRLRSGETLRRVDFVFNGVLPRVSSVTPTSGDYAESHSIVVRGTNLGSLIKAQLAGPSIVRLEAVAVSSTRIDATVPAFVVPGDYRLIVTTAKGASSAAPGAYRVTESAPSIEFFAPVLARNDRATPITVSGLNLLGTRSIRLAGDGLPDVELENLSVSIADPDAVEGAPAGGVGFSFYVAVGEVPRGTLPGSYRLILTNTAAATPPSVEELAVVELAPLLAAGGVEPSRFNNSRAVDIRILGQNLAGTRTVELVGEPGEFDLTVRSTSLSEVVATVPAGLPAGVYSVALTNSIGSVTSGDELTITRKSGGGGGGCGAVISPGPLDGPPDFTLFVMALLALSAIICRTARSPAPSTGRPLT